MKAETAIKKHAALAASEIKMLLLHCGGATVRHRYNTKAHTMQRTGIFVGSFDPFTAGHDSIVQRALPLFDRLVIGVGVNAGKQCMLPPGERVAAISRLYEGEGRISVEQYSGLTVDFARRVGAQFVVKGVRSVKDFEFEREQADINRSLTGLETLVFFALPGMESVSSTVVRELTRYGRDCAQFMPRRK